MAPAGRPGRRRLYGSLALGAAIIVTAGLLWPNSPDGPDGSSTGTGGTSGETRTADAPARGAAAAKELQKLPGLHLRAVYGPGSGKPQTEADLTVTADGKATGTLRMPVTGQAAMAWSGSQLYLKGDKEFWAQQNPHYGGDVSSSGHWVAPVKRDGYYMLDSFGINAGSLNPKSLASLVRTVTSDPSVVTEDAGSMQGRKVTSYSAGGRMVILADAAPHTLFAIGANPADASPVRTAAWPRTTGSAVRLAAYGDGDGYYNPYLVAKPEPATDKEVAAARADAAEAQGTAVPPLTSAEKVAASQGPVFTTTFNSPYLCSSNPCSYSFTVTNTGDEPGDATLHVAFPGTSERVHPLGTLAPGQSKGVSGIRPNVAAGTGKTVRHTDYSWVYSTAVYGPDPKVAQRLHARELEPGDVFVATPLEPLAANLLDLMTKNAEPADTQTNEKAVEALRAANSRGQLPLLMTIAASGRLANPQDLADSLSTTDEIGGARVLQQVAHLLKTDPKARVWFDGGYKAGDGQTYKTDYIFTSSRDGQEIRRAVQVKTIEAWKKLWPRIAEATRQLNGENKKGKAQQGKRGPEKAPPGFERVVQINLEPSVGQGFFYGKADLERVLRHKNYAQARQNLCMENGAFGLDRLVIVNSTGTHEWTDLSKLDVPCQSPGR
ncbi:hypothetical protein [Streptomyces sp. NPDC048196]|uniref:hypothetical protein n=1 Tax=Streptomyces sp. NPDC048196 TaxID=3154712 RepID=UPI00340F4E66